MEKFVVATNVNDVVPAYPETGIFEPRQSAKTISNAMDVGNPSKLARMLALYDYDLDRLRAICTAPCLRMRIPSGQ